jgi:type IV pilus assembly protein PilW
MKRIHPLMPAYPGAQAQRGFSLVELLVALALSMVIVIATTYVYLGTRETQRTLFEKAYATETAHYTLDVIGRDIENAGFYPSNQVGLVGAPVVQTYTNPVTASPPAAYNAKVFGCQAQMYDPTSSPPACAAHTGTVDADALMLNSYSNDASGLDIGNRADCLRQDSANDSVNAARRNAGHPGASLPPIQPLFVSNRYTLVANTAQVEGQAISTFSLACNGNGGTGYQPIVAGVDQLRFYYLERADTTTNSQFQRANGVTNWANVVAVRVCLMARSLQAARLQGSTSYTIADCDGTARSFTDGIERKIFSQIFALKNHIQITNP